MTDGEWKWIRQRLWATAKKRALEKGLPFTIKPEDIPFPENGRCPILDVELVKHKGKMERNTPSLDRLSSEKGYEPGNVKVISWWANYLKTNMTAEQVGRMAEYMGSNNEQSE